MDSSMPLPDSRLQSSSPMALPIVMLRDKNQELTHEECLLAAFSHMATIVGQSQSGEWTADWQIPYDAWKGGKFRKIVKRANPQRFAGLAEDPQAIHTTMTIGDKLIELLSFPPYPLSDPDPRVRPLQVAGLDYPKKSSFPLESKDCSYFGDQTKPRSRGDIVVAYDGELGASTGKMMAQAAHGAQLLKLKYPQWEFSSRPVSIINNFEENGVEWILEVRDAGFTEVAPNSNTVRVGVYTKA